MQKPITSIGLKENDIGSKMKANEASINTNAEIDLFRPFLLEKNFDADPFLFELIKRQKRGVFVSLSENAKGQSGLRIAK